MSASCRCGSQVDHAFHAFACIECGAACCPACAVPLESVTYCGACARSLLGVGAVPPGAGFELH